MPEFPDSFVDLVLDKEGTIMYLDAERCLHNPYGPAIRYYTGNKGYYIHGKYIRGISTFEFGYWHAYQLGKSHKHALKGARTFFSTHLTGATSLLRFADGRIALP